MDAILKRRSVRKFDLTKKVSEEDLKRLCFYAEQAPTARNQKSRAYVIVNDEELISKLSDVSQGSRILKGANSCIAILGRDKKELSTPEMQECDLAAATENLLLEATNMGLGSCWMGIYPISDRVALCNEILNVKENEFVYALVAIGYPENPTECFYNKDKEPIITLNRR